MKALNNDFGNGHSNGNGKSNGSMNGNGIHFGNGFPGGSSDYESEEVSLQEYIRILLRGKWIIFLSFAVVFASTLIFTLKTKPVYEATASVLVDTKGQQGSMLFFDPIGMSLVKNINNELEILKSRPIAQEVAEMLLKKGYTDENKKHEILIIHEEDPENENKTIASSASDITDRIIESVDFSPVKDSDLIKITAKSTSPEEAALIANTYAHAYYERNLHASRTRTRAAREFLEEQVKAKQKALDESENVLQNFMEKKGIVSLDEEATQMIEQISQLEAMLDATDIEMQSIRQTLDSYRAELARQEPNVAKVIGEASDPYIKLLQEQIATLEVQKDVVVANNPDLDQKKLYDEKLVEIDNQISVLRNKLEQRTKEYLQSLLPGQGDNPGYSLMQLKQNIVEKQIELQAEQAKKMELNKVLAKYQRQFEKLPQKSIEYARLQRARLSNEKLYLLVQEKYNEATIAEQSQFGYIEIINPAIVPQDPVSPKTKSNLILGALIGLGLGIGIVFLLEYLNNKIQTPEDLRKKGYSPLSVVPLMDDEIRKMGGKAEIAMDGKRVDVHLLAYVNPRSVISEAYRRLRTNIQFSRLDRSVQTILVTSPGPGEGKSTTSSNLAITLAQTGKKVLLIDADMRRPSIHRTFRVEKEPGLTNLLFGKATEEDTIQHTFINNLDIIGSGKIPPNPSEILGSQQMRDFLNAQKEKYDMIIYDSPPILAVTDPAVISTLVDGVIMVVSAANTRLDAFQESIELIEGVSGKILGIVLNNFDHQKAYGGYYGYYRSRYYTYYYQYSSNEPAKKRKRKSVADTTVDK